MPEPSTQAEIARLVRYADNETDKLRDALRRLDEQADELDRLRDALARIVERDHSLSCNFCSAAEIATAALRGERWLDEEEQLARDLADPDA